jgi:hypothetical protein
MSLIDGESWWEEHQARARRLTAICSLVAFGLAVILFSSEIREFLSSHHWWEDMLAVLSGIALPVLAFFELRHSGEANELRREANEHRAEAIRLQQMIGELEAEKAGHLAHIAELERERNEHLAQIAANAERSIRLQEIVQQQWLVIDGWRREGFSSRETNPPHFTIAADISNPTDLPLTIKFITVKMPGGPSADYEVGNVLPPHGDAIKFTYSHPVKPEWLSGYEKYSLPIILEGVVTYVDCFQNERIQRFRRGCILGPVNHFVSHPMAPPDNKQ